MKNPLSIAWGGEGRLRKAIEEQVRREFQEKLEAAQGQQKVDVEQQIKKEAKRRFKEVASPHSLYGSGG